MTQTLVFEVGLPYRELSSNGNIHWRTKTRLVKEYREEAKVIAASAMLLAKWVAPLRVDIALEFGTKGGRKVRRYQPRDEQNAIAAAKSLIDGVVDAGVVADDSRHFVHFCGATINSNDGPWVRVTVTEAS